VLKRIQTAGNPAAFKAGTKYQGLCEDFGEPPMANSFQFDAVFEDGALWKHGNVGQGIWEDGALFKHGNLYQGIYVDPMRDVVGVYYSTCPVTGDADLLPAYNRQAAKNLAGK